MISSTSSQKKSLSTPNDTFIATLADYLYQQALNAYRRGRRSIRNQLPKGDKRDFDDDLSLYLRDGNLPAAQWFKAQSFTTALVHDDRIRTRIKAALAGNLRRGEGAKSFRNTVNDTLRRNGLSKLSPHQLNTIRRTNSALAYANGQVAQLRASAEDFPYWQYVAVRDSRTRDNHQALHGKIFKAGDTEYYPPLGFNCRCTARPLTARQAGRARKQYPQRKPPKSLENDSFIGNKNKKFLTWADEEIKKTSPQTLRHIKKKLETSDEVYTARLSPALVGSFSAYLQKVIGKATAKASYARLDKKIWKKTSSTSREDTSPHTGSA